MHIIHGLSAGSPTHSHPHQTVLPWIPADRLPQLFLMPKEPHQKLGAPRQRPVSCQFCRTRKLRCSRDSPCSNCRSRNIPCELEQPVQVAAASGEDDRAELLERIRKLEAIVEQSTSSTTASTQSSSPGSSNGPGIPSRHARANINSGDQQTRNISKPSPIEQLDRDFAWLESLYDGTDSLVCMEYFLSVLYEIMTRRRLGPLALCIYM